MPANGVIRVVTLCAALAGHEKSICIRNNA
jgi:hypothetical protein